MKSYAITPYAASTSVLRPNHKVTGPPKLPPELERQIFEVCALESPEFSLVLVQVACRVHLWSVVMMIIHCMGCFSHVNARIDPILIATVCIMEGQEYKRRRRLKGFFAKLTNGKPAEYYVQHIKNLAIYCPFSSGGDINRILAICSGVENLLLVGPAWGFDLFKNPQAGRHLRRLTVNLSQFECSPQLGSTSYFYHPCFANLTHLHLMDDDGDWSTYAGWETLTSLTHLAFAYYASAGPEEIIRLMQTLPTLQYVALGYYRGSDVYGDYVDTANAWTTVNNNPHTRAEWGVRVVFLGRIPECDWERGARGQGDFWDVVEGEVKRGLRVG